MWLTKYDTLSNERDENKAEERARPACILFPSLYATTKDR